MSFLRTRRFIIAAVILAIGLPTTYLLARDKGTTDSTLVGQVKRGDFQVNVTTSGELRAPKFVLRPHKDRCYAKRRGSEVKLWWAAWPKLQAPRVGPSVSVA